MGFFKSSDALHVVNYPTVLPLPGYFGLLGEAGEELIPRVFLNWAPTVDVPNFVVLSDHVGLLLPRTVQIWGWALYLWGHHDPLRVPDLDRVHTARLPTGTRFDVTPDLSLGAGSLGLRLLRGYALPPNDKPNWISFPDVSNL